MGGSVGRPAPGRGGGGGGEGRSAPRRSAERRELLMRIIELCERAASGGDPFRVNVVELVRMMRAGLRDLETDEELRLDLEALVGLSKVVAAQEEWLERRAALLFLDPLMVALKAEVMDPRELADCLRAAWRPVVEARGVTPSFVEAAVEYWMGLPPRGSGGPGLPAAEEPWPAAGGVEPEEPLEEELAWALDSLRRAAGRGGRITYGKALEAAGGFESRVRLGYLISFLLSRGDISAARDPSTGELILILSPASGEPDRSVVAEAWAGSRGDQEGSDRAASASAGGDVNA